jgi:hypothetical protein
MYITYPDIFLKLLMCFQKVISTVKIVSHITTVVEDGLPDLNNPGVNLRVAETEVLTKIISKAKVLLGKYLK